MKRFHTHPHATSSQSFAVAVDVSTITVVAVTPLGFQLENDPVNVVADRAVVVVANSQDGLLEQ